MLVIASVGLGLWFVRQVGWLEPLELSAYDFGMRLRPSPPPETRLAIVGVREDDIQALGTWPVTDGVMAQLLEQIATAKPAAVGLDLYRDVPVGEGAPALAAAYQNLPGLSIIRRMADDFAEGVQPPPSLDTPQRSGFNNLVLDRDGRIRRQLLYWWANDPKTGERRRFSSLALVLAERYLAPFNIAMRPAGGSNPHALAWGATDLKPLGAGAGGYQHTDVESGYQILADFRGPSGTIPTLSFSEVLNGRFDRDRLRGRVVLVGAATESLKDYSYTAYSDRGQSSPEPMFGVELHAQFVSQLLDLAIGHRNPLRPSPEWLEWLAMALLPLVSGALCGWRPLSSLAAVGMVAGAIAIAAAVYGALLVGWWLPVVSPLLAWLSGGAVMTLYIARQQRELVRSKEFLSHIIDTIPDPIFVKDRDRRWIVLNRAFCDFIGRPLHELLERRAEDVLPSTVATAIYAQDLQTFATGETQESDSVLMGDREGDRVFTTKRSLHRDRAGNVFLVGVLRDVTLQRQMEAELKRTAAELRSHNEQLRISEDFLRYQATHDALTDLPNRKLLQERLTSAIAWTCDNQLMGALMFLDLDGFKGVNDTYGHHAGDLLLKDVAQRLSADLRSSDIVARLGGDEFAILLPAIPRRDIADRVAEKIVETVSRPYNLEGQTATVTTSIGIAFFPSDGTDPKVLLERADVAMFQAKRRGRNQFTIYSALESLATTSDRDGPASPTDGAPPPGRCDSGSPSPSSP